MRHNKKLSYGRETVRRILQYSMAILRGWVILRLNLSLNGYVSRQYLWTIRWSDGLYYNFALQVFTQRNFVADVIRLKLNFIKKTKITFWATLWETWGNVCTRSTACWKARGRLPTDHNWTFFTIRLLHLRRYKLKSVEVGVFWRGWVTLSAISDGRGVGHQPLLVPEN